MRYLYIQAVVDNDLMDSGAISFRHTIVEATSEGDAYCAGGRWGDREFIYHPDKQTVNDYVIELEGQR